MATLGVTVTTGSIGPSAVPTVGYSSGFFLVQTPWGVDNVVGVCSSFGDFLRLYGGLNALTTLGSDDGVTPQVWGTITTDSVVQGFYAVKGFFDERLGAQNGVAYIERVLTSVAPPTAAFRTFASAGTATTVTSKWKGLAGGSTTVTGPATSTKGTSYRKWTFTHSQSGITEVVDLSLTGPEVADFNRRSQLVTVTMGDTIQTAVATTVKLGNGTAGTADPFTANSTQYIGATSAAGVKTGLDVFTDKRLGSGLLCAPGQYGATLRVAMNTHATTYDRTAIISSPAGLVLNTIVADLATTLTGNNTVYYTPQIKVADQNSDTGGTLTVDPCGHIAGLYARMDAEYRGPHKSAAGITHPLYSVVDVERSSNQSELYDDSGSNTLADSNINTIRIKQGVVVWGLRTLATDKRYQQINTSRTVQVVRLTCFLIAEPLTFEPIDSDGNLFAKAKGNVGAFLYQLRLAGALFGDFPGSEPKPSDAYAVICDRGNNSDITLAAGILRIDIAIIPTPNAEQVQINILVGSPGSVPAAK